ncbi:MAG: hypothetical protein K9I59_01300 [Chlorobium sp.]|uniref:hypothetical protein n=1 Tax=Chlorobium sp. TaxID=1095 RepID=UPI0025BEEA74|nr:hypothetical protein [Chlorobium sp.]MCF8215490.1 hypothetical protein [Chlorobium sp.]MCF8270285.1 hypothetical protein [Chlorobium sp.]MCF8286697.1 hypothetical protein [Chlorobium sp.]MCF8290390.1 hypothetical protein [Chlorobium sp.]MCF8384273.1 hypothetical protein [Chlorobium sp.]
MKKLCKCDGKTLHCHVRRLAATGRRPRYICELCGRASGERKQLCKPVRITKKSAKKPGS